MPTDYWWCWLGLGVNLAYIFFLNGLLVLFLAFLPPYGANAVVAKTEEELYDRHVALFGDANSADDIVVEMSETNGHENVTAHGHEHGHDVGNDHIKAEVGRLLKQMNPLHLSPKSTIHIFPIFSLQIQCLHCFMFHSSDAQA